MYLHLGQSIIIPTRDILGIFDLDNASYSHITRNFLRDAEERGQVFTVSEELPKSFVLCGDEKGNYLVYISQLSSSTLLRRCESGIFETSEL